jgi:hypothetical protein
MLELIISSLAGLGTFLLVGWAWDRTTALEAVGREARPAGLMEIILEIIANLQIYTNL